MRFIKFLTVVGLLAILVLGGYELVQMATGSGTNPTRKSTNKPAPTITATEMAGLKEQLETILATSTVSSSVTVIDTTSGEQITAGLDVPFRAASTTKVLSAAAYMHEVEQGNAKLTTMIQGSTAQSLMQRMLNQSDNNAWAALDSYLGESNLQTYAESIGLTSFEPLANVLTTKDMASLLNQMYTHKIMTKQHADLLFSYMQDTNNEDLIPAGLPTGATVFHKFGFYEGELHDAGVVTYKNRTFILVIYTNNQLATTNDYAARSGLMHQVTAKTAEQIPLLAND